MQNVISWLETRRDLCFELLRIYLGVGLFAKGVLFAADPQQIERLTRGGQLDAAAAVIQHYVVLAHLCGGVMLAAGLLTRVAALANVPILLGAVLFVHQQDGLFTRAQGLEFSLFVLFVLGLIAWHGSGRWSLDRLLFRPAPVAPTGLQPVPRRRDAGKQRTA